MKSKKAHKFILLIIPIALFLIFAYSYQIPGLLRIPGISVKGRYLTFPFLDMNICASPRSNKMIKYINKKYNETFHMYNGEEFLKGRYHCPKKSWADSENGIIVTRDNNSNKYYYVRDYYGHILDNYCLYMRKSEVESFLYDLISPYIDDEFSVFFIPLDLQIADLSSDSDINDILRYGLYSIQIVIHNDGSNVVSDINDICSALSDYYFDNDDLDSYVEKYYKSSSFIVDRDWNRCSTLCVMYCPSEQFCELSDDKVCRAYSDLIQLKMTGYLINSPWSNYPETCLAGYDNFWIGNESVYEYHSP